MSPASRFAFADILTVLDALPVGVMMVSLDGEVLHMNRALAGLTGFAQDEVNGLPCRHILRSRPCVAGCDLGCRSFAAAGNLSVDTLLAGGLDGVGAPDTGGLKTDILTLKRP